MSEKEDRHLVGFFGRAREERETSIALLDQRKGKGKGASEQTDTKHTALFFSSSASLLLLVLFFLSLIPLLSSRLVSSPGSRIDTALFLLSFCSIIVNGGGWQGVTRTGG